MPEVQGRARADLVATWLPVLTVSVAIVGLFHESFGSMAQQWRTSTFSYGYLVAPMSLLILWRDRHALATVKPEPFLPGLALVALVAGAWVVGMVLRVDVLHQAAAVAALGLSAWTILGTRAARLMAFPLGYLLLMVPVGDFLIPPLMGLTADFAVHAVSASGVPVYQSGYVFSLPSGDFEVIRECSGIRFLMATIAAGLVFSRLAYRSWRRRLVFLAACCVVPVVANLLRAYGVVMLVNMSNMRFAANGDHIFYGTIFFASVLLAMFVIGARFAQPAVAPQCPVTAPAPGHVRISLVAAGLVALITGLAAAMPGWLRAPIGELAATDLPALPVLGAEWAGPDEEQTNWRPVFVGAAAEQLARYRGLGGDAIVDVYRVGYAPDDSGKELTSSINALWDPAGWREVSKSGSVSLPDAGGRYSESVLRGKGGAGRVVWSWYLVNGQATTSRVVAKLLELAGLLRGGRLQLEMVALSAPFQESPDNARNTLQRFVSVACPDPDTGHEACGLTPRFR